MTADVHPPVATDDPTDSALRHLRDALVLCQAAVEDIAQTNHPEPLTHAVRARTYLTLAIQSMEDQ